jgi:hypothetical protein
MVYSGGILSGWIALPPRGAHGGAALLGSSPLCFGKVLWFTQNVMAVRHGDLVKHLIHGLLDAGIRLMKFTRCLGSKLAKHIPVPQSMECVKYTIRAHVGPFSFKMNNLGFDPILRPMRDGQYG